MYTGSFEKVVLCFEFKVFNLQVIKVLQYMYSICYLVTADDFWMG